MNLVIGILLFGLGLIAFGAWFKDIVPFLKGVLVLSLLFWGAVAFVVGLAKSKSKAQLSRAKKDEASAEETV